MRSWYSPQPEPWNQAFESKRASRARRRGPRVDRSVVAAAHARSDPRQSNRRVGNVMSESRAELERAAPPILTATVHDSGAHFLPGVERVGSIINEIFGAVAIQATTRLCLRSRGARADLHAIVGQAPADGRLGLHRRLAVVSPCRRLLRSCASTSITSWLEADRKEVETTLAAAKRFDLAVVGRTVGAYERLPAPSARTEAIATHVYELTAGHQWDLRFGVRVSSPGCATAILMGCLEGRSRGRGPPGTKRRNPPQTCFLVPADVPSCRLWRTSRGVFAE